MVGIPTVIAGAIALGLVNTGYVSPAAVGAGIPIILTATAIGLLITTIWAAALGQNASASLFAVFFGFYGSYAVLVLGLTHNWFAIPADQVTETTEMWLICWLATIGLLTLTTLRLPWSFTLPLGLVDVALVLLLVATIKSSAAWTHAGGAVVFAFIAVAVYLFVESWTQKQAAKVSPRESFAAKLNRPTAATAGSPGWELRGQYAAANLSTAARCTRSDQTADSPAALTCGHLRRDRQRRLPAGSWPPGRRRPRPRSCDLEHSARHGIADEEHRAGRGSTTCEADGGTDAPSITG